MKKASWLSTRVKLYNTIDIDNKLRLKIFKIMINQIIEHESKNLIGLKNNRITLDC